MHNASRFTYKYLKSYVQTQFHSGIKLSVVKVMIF